MAAPMVSAAAIVLREAADRAGISLTPAEVLGLLRESGVTILDGDDEDDNVPNTPHSYIRMDLQAALSLLERRAATAGESTPSRQIAKDEAIAAVMSCLARLRDDQRTVVQLRFLEGRSVADVAEHLGKTEPAIHMLCHRGLTALRESMVSITHYLSRL